MAKKLKRKPKKLLIIIIVIAILGIICGCYFMFFNNNTVKESKVVSKIPKYGYVLKDNKSSAYKKLFQELKKTLSKEKVDEKLYAKIITKMFIVDFYSLNDHSAKTDVGGTDFIYGKALDNFLINAEDTIYKYVESNIYKQRKQKLPIVDKVTIEKINNIEFEYDGKEDEKAYDIYATWTYSNNKVAEGYQKNAHFIFVHEGNKLELVEVNDGSNEDEE